MVGIWLYGIVLCQGTIAMLANGQITPLLPNIQPETLLKQHVVCAKKLQIIRGIGHNSDPNGLSS
jgi:hypothetical protein